MRIVLVNAHWNNRGDEAALYALIDGIWKFDSKIRIDIIFKETKTVTQFLYEGRIRYITTRFRPQEDEVKSAIAFPESCKNADMKREMEFLRNADMVIYAPGGSVISDRFWWTKQLEYLFPVIYAQSCGIKTFFAAPSIGPFTEKHRYRNEILCKVNAICLRENIGKSELIRSVGESELSNCMVGNDLVFLGNVNMEENNNIFREDRGLVEYCKKYEKVAAITITDLSWNVEFAKNEILRKRIEDSFKQFIHWLEEKGIGMILIPQLFGEQNDRDYLIKYEEVCTNVFVLSEKYDHSFQQYLISKCYAVVGLRYHSNIFAAKMEVPMIPIIYEQKIRGFCQDSDIYEWGIEIDQLSDKILKVKFMELEKDYRYRKKKLFEKNKEWLKKSQRTMEALNELIKNSVG